MKCSFCQAENKEKADLCKECGADLHASLWKPTWRWHLKTLGIIYLVLTVLYFLISGALNRVPPPYRLRDIPKEMTPWLK